jgi:hypothetical protein
MSYEQTPEEVLDIIARVTAQAQADAQFRDEYIQDPNSVLHRAGLEIHPSVKFAVRKVSPASSPQFQVNDGDTVYLVLPEVEEVVQDESIATAAAASCQSTASTAGTVTTCVSTASTASTQSCT